MIYRDFQNIKISGLGLGMMRFPTIGDDDGKIDEAKTEEIIDCAYKNGINYFDTAWGYHNGQSELIAGKYLSKYPRESYYLASKFPGYDRNNMSKVAEIFERQLEKCQTQYFDFYLFHTVCESNIDDYLNPEFGIMDYLLKQKEKGRIRHIGFSNHGTYETVKRFLDAYGEHIEFCQLQLNYVDYHYQKAKETAELMNDLNIPIWVMEPLRGGKLATASPKMTNQMKAMRPDESVPGWAFRFLQTIPGVTLTLSGMSTMEQLKDNIKIWSEDKPLTQTEFNLLVAIADNEAKQGGLPCTACHYCISYCPKKLPIPELITFYNENEITGDTQSVKNSVGNMPSEKYPSNCIGCKKCEQVCPQKIKISEMMSDFSEKLGM